jgi:hypothetical protein
LIQKPPPRLRYAQLRAPKTVTKTVPLATASTVKAAAKELPSTTKKAVPKKPEKK